MNDNERRLLEEQGEGRTIHKDNFFKFVVDDLSEFPKVRIFRNDEMPTLKCYMEQE